MIEVDTNYCQIVRDSITGERVVDEQTFGSLAILTERLQRLKKLDNAFSDIAFSSAVKKLRSRENAIAVG